MSLINLASEGGVAGFAFDETFIDILFTDYTVLSDFSNVEVRISFWASAPPSLTNPRLLVRMKIRSPYYTTSYYWRLIKSNVKLNCCTG